MTWREFAAYFDPHSWRQVTGQIWVCDTCEIDGYKLSKLIRLPDG